MITFNTPLLSALPYSIILAVGIFALLYVIQIIIAKKIEFITKRTAFTFDDAIVEVVHHIKLLSLVSIAIYIAIKPLPLPQWAMNIATVVFLFALFTEVVQILEKIIIAILGKSVADPSSLYAITLVVRILLWVVGIIMILSNIGVNVTSLIASLGIGGLAISLALQSVFQDLFSSFSILIDKPFEVGDMIVLSPEYSGTVERIGFKTTRLRTLQGEQLIVPNSQLTNQKVQNFKKLNTRRVLVNIGVTYNTSPELLEAIPGMLENIITPIPLAVFNRAHFQMLAPSSLNFELVYFVESSEYSDYVAAEQSINLGIIKAFHDAGIEFAYPTQTVVLQK